MGVFGGDYVEVLISSLAERFTEYSEQEIADMISCLSKDQLAFYTSDIGITFSQDDLASRLNVSTVDGDEQWVDYKLKIFFERLKTFAGVL